MTDNSVQQGTDTIRDKDRGGVKTQIVGLDLTPAGASETLMSGAMPVTGTVSVNNPAGAFGYAAGSSGTPTIPATARVASITAHCTTAGSLTINGGVAIPIPANSSFSATYTDGKLVTPTLVFTGTDSYYVDWLV